MGFPHHQIKQATAVAEHFVEVVQEVLLECGFIAVYKQVRRSVLVVLEPSQRLNDGDDWSSSVCSDSHVVAVQ